MACRHTRTWSTTAGVTSSEYVAELLPAQHHDVYRHSDRCEPQRSGQKTTTVTVGGGGGSGGGGPISCPGYSSTQTVNLAWSTGASATIPAGESDAIVITFTPLGEIGASGSSITAFEYGSSAAPRFAVLSTTPCDFAYQPAQLGIYASQSGTTVSQKMNLPGGTKTQAVKIVAGTKYYWNIQMAPGTCGGNCQMRTTITP